MGSSVKETHGKILSDWGWCRPARHGLARATCSGRARKPESLVDSHVFRVNPRWNHIPFTFGARRGEAMNLSRSKGFLRVWALQHSICTFTLSLYISKAINEDKNV